jgi:hypothetical protein
MRQEFINIFNDLHSLVLVAGEVSTFPFFLYGSSRKLP